MNKPKSFESLQNYPDKIVAVFVDYHEAMNKARKAATVPVGASGDQIRAAQDKLADLSQKAENDSLTLYSNLLAAVNSHEKSAQKEIDLSLGFRVDSADTQENLLREMRERSAWERIKPVLDREDVFSISNSLGALVRDFALSHDKDSLSVIRRELPLYLRARFPKDDIFTEAIDAFERALADTLPEAVSALTFQRELRSGVYQLRMAISYAEYAIKQNELEFVIPVWEKGKNVVVTTTGSRDLTVKDSQI
jgi:hypothetical protein